MTYKRGLSLPSDEDLTPSRTPPGLGGVAYGLLDRTGWQRRVVADPTMAVPRQVMWMIVTMKFLL